MSIQPIRVVARIVEDVASAPSVDLAHARLGARAKDAVVECVRRPLDGGPAFPSLFHFWAHGLRGFLERRGEGDQLVAIACFAMCESIDGDTFARVLAERVEEAPSPTGALLEAYRMIDGPCRGSVVAATRTEWVACTWGARMAWCAGVAGVTIGLHAARALRRRSRADREPVTNTDCRRRRGCAMLRARARGARLAPCACAARR